MTKFIPLFWIQIPAPLLLINSTYHQDKTSRRNGKHFSKKYLTGAQALYPCLEEMCYEELSVRQFYKSFKTISKDAEILNL